ncbi:hypothetical protein DL1_11930 [Thioclava dalianensis]|uniref:HK97 gp10 family phage protein n=1 Tax=Thioclava dalianensis TaxID=1185766 RepID=A0A074TE20_9RHOB|nr:HK97-gp10 family putative phage morphogenesis protein [Thioclava dalianensis]KEP68415.1 hypothetical protein DL1_11930 [Thioclava dalianensis]SFN62602.1 phage protein, HK97 gp10 family [Thioclava dalianensis]
MTVTVKTTGFKDLEAALEQIEKKTTAKATMRRALKTAAQPVADLAQSLAPVGATRALSTSVAVSTKLSKRQRGLHRKMFRNDKAAVEMFVGAGPLSSAHQQEFGNIYQAPQPFLRPAWDAESKATLDRIAEQMWIEIEKTAQRAARRAAKGK